MHLPLRRYWNLFSRYLKPHKLRLALLGLLIFSHIGLRLLNPQIMRFFIDTAIAGGAQATLIRAGLLFMGVALVNQLLSIGNTLLGEQVAWSATNALRLDLLLHVLKLDPTFHKSYTPGELLERIDGDVNDLSNFFSRLTIYLLGNLLLIAGVLVLLFLEDWRVGLGVSVFAMLSLAFMLRIREIATPHWARVRQISAEFFGFLGEALSAMEDVRANGAQGYILRRFHGLMLSWYPLRLRAVITTSVLWMTNIGSAAIGTAIAFAISAYLWRRGAISLGSAYLIFYYTDLLRQPMNQIRTQMESLQRAEASLGRIEALAAAEPRLKDGTGAWLPSGALEVAFHDVSFGYEVNEPVLQGVSFTLAPGRVLGLLGRTGSGKTTLARLLLRLYDPSSGELRVGGVPPNQLPLRQLRERVKLVTQEVQLFQASIRENLTLFNPDITDEQIFAALHGLGLGDWLAAQPNRLDTQLQGGGAGLSAGQAQLLAFARIFLSNPGLVILDEASSRLDPATERLIEQAVDRLLDQRTGILIAHHLATVQRTDDILILENGRVSEYGERTALAADPGSRFSQLLRAGQLEEMLA